MGHKGIYACDAPSRPTTTSVAPKPVLDRTLDKKICQAFIDSIAARKNIGGDDVDEDIPIEHRPTPSLRHSQGGIDHHQILTLMT